MGKFSDILQTKIKFCEYGREYCIYKNDEECLLKGEGNHCLYSMLVNPIPMTDSSIEDIPLELM